MVEKTEIEEIVRDVLSSVVQRQIGQGEVVERGNEPHWDSLKHVEIIFMLEDRLGVRFTESQMSELNSSCAIIDCVSKLL